MLWRSRCFPASIFRARKRDTKRYERTKAWWWLDFFSIDNQTVFTLYDVKLFFYRELFICEKNKFHSCEQLLASQRQQQQFQRPPTALLTCLWKYSFLTQKERRRLETKNCVPGVFLPLPIVVNLPALLTTETSIAVAKILPMISFFACIIYTLHYCKLPIAYLPLFLACKK